MNIFVTGTDTNIGKTVISAILAIKFGFKYWKPIQCGLYEQSDSDWIQQYVGDNRVQKEGYRLKEALSPHLAARCEKKEIKLLELLSQFPADNTIIEGVGGLLVPLNKNELLIDFIPQNNCRVILVARSSLGTINHTLLSIEALRIRDLDLWGVIMVGDRNYDNKVSIEKYGKTTVLAEIPFIKTMTKETLLEVSRHISMELI